MSLRKIIDGKTYSLTLGITCSECAGGIGNSPNPILCNKLGTDCLLGVEVAIGWVEVKKKRFGRK